MWEGFRAGGRRFRAEGRAREEVSREGARLAKMFGFSGVWFLSPQSCGVTVPATVFLSILSISILDFTRFIFLLYGKGKYFSVSLTIATIAAQTTCYLYVTDLFVFFKVHTFTYKVNKIKQLTHKLR